MSNLTLSGVNKVYPNGAHAVRGVDMTIDDGEFIVFVGPSGCGKSTLLRMVAGLEEISGGDISIDGKRINDLSPSDRDIAMVFQNYALYPHMTVYKNMSYGLVNRKIPKDQIDEQVRKTASLLHIEEYLDRKPSQLSGGQRQRVAMGRAIVRNPKVFLFDEPLSNLDAKLRVQMRIEIKKLQRELGVTSIYVTHDQVEAMTLADRLAVISDGLIEQLGTPIELYERPASLFVASFIGSPSMNFAPAKISADGNAVDLEGGAKFDLPAGVYSEYANTTVTLGIRPEDLILVDSSESSANLTTSLVEHLGADTLVYGHFGTDQTDMTIRLGGIKTFDIGDLLPLKVSPEKIHLFNPETGKRLG
jgi:sn-glycerol 3-phosphate transport system ATP-binding protein